MACSAAIQAALGAPTGARFRKCVLQLNPFQYVIDNKKPTAFADELSYNTAMVEALLKEAVEVVAVADHFRVKESQGLWKAAEAAGIIVLPGFEAVSTTLRAQVKRERFKFWDCNGRWYSRIPVVSGECRMP